jgi:recombination protein RecA
MSRLRSTKKAEEPEENKGSELKDVIKDVEKLYGKGVLTPATKVANFTHVDTGIFVLDFALLGGVVEGLASMMYGWESSGKSTVCLRLVANKQKKHPKKTVVWVDTEGTFDKTWAEKHGIDLAKLTICTPSSGEQAVDMVDALSTAKEVSMVVLDSIPATVPSEILEKSAQDETISKLARLMGKLCSKLQMNRIKERRRGHHVDMVFINQFRMNVGAMYGDPRVLPGGKQINFFCSTKVELKAKEITGADDYGNKIALRNAHTFKISKTKSGSSIRDGEFEMTTDPSDPLGLGVIDDYKTVASFAKKMGYITGGGASWKIYGVDNTFRKLDDIRQFLIDTPEEYLRLKQLLIAKQREMRELPPIPSDGYLLGKVDKEWIMEGLKHGA